MTDALLIRGVRAVLPGGCCTPAVSLLVRDGLIAETGDAIRETSDAAVIEAAGRWLLPGLLDMQLNDAAWFAEGPRTAEEHARRVRDVLRFQASRGVTGLMLATLAAPVEEIESYLAGLARARDASDDPLRTVCLGGLVEGTFMNPACHGAHNPKWILPPDRTVLDRLIATGGMRAVNIAPEMAPDATDLIAYATRQGVLVGCGHARPHARRLREAVDAGLRYIIHFGNGPTGSSLKGFDDGGMLEEALRNDGLTVTIIVDNVHVHPQLVRDWIARKDVARVVGVSDAGFALGPPDASFEVYGVRGRVAPHDAYLEVVPDAEAASPNPLASDAHPLFGSAVDARSVFENLLNLLTRPMAGIAHRTHPAMSLAEAVCAASAMCSENPARLLGLDDRGRLERGARADMVLARIEGEPGHIAVTIENTFVAGRPVSA